MRRTGSPLVLCQAVMPTSVARYTHSSNTESPLTNGSKRIPRDFTVPPLIQSPSGDQKDSAIDLGISLVSSSTKRTGLSMKEEGRMSEVAKCPNWSAERRCMAHSHLAVCSENPPYMSAVFSHIYQMPLDLDSLTLDLTPKHL